MLILNAFTVAAIALSPLLVSSVYASEHDDAIAICERVETLRVAEYQEKGQKTPRVDCTQNSNPPVYWQCMEKEMTDGNPFVYSAQKCKSQ